MLTMADVCVLVLTSRPSSKRSLEPAEMASWNDSVVEIPYDSAYAKPMPKPTEVPGFTRVSTRVPLTWCRWSAAALAVTLMEPNRATGSTMRFTFSPALTAVTPLPVASPLPAMTLNGLRPDGSRTLPVTVKLARSRLASMGCQRAPTLMSPSELDRLECLVESVYFEISGKVKFAVRLFNTP